MNRARGFTLVEAIMVIVITGILAGMVAVFIKAPVDAYFDVARRGTLSDAADTALRRLGRDLRQAVPNSVRVNSGCSAANCYLEYLPATDGGRYRVALTSALGGNILDFTSAADTSFDVLGPAVTTSAGDYLVIFNTAQPSAVNCATAPGGADAYEGCNRRTITGFSSPVLSFTATSRPLPFDSPGHRFQIVPSSGPVTYACENVGISAGDGTGTLKRYTGYGFASSQPISFGSGSNSLLANVVSACAITYASGVTARNALVSIQLTLTRSNESVALYHEVHVDNAP